MKYLLMYFTLLYNKLLVRQVITLPQYDHILRT
jgi:hypothetical protein